MSNRSFAGSSPLQSIVCHFITAVFAVFTFCYVYFLQCDVLALTQHELSGGKTQYARLMGALIITFIALLIQRGISMAFRSTPTRCYALTLVPSAIFIYILTGLIPAFSVGGLLCAIAVFVAWLLCIISMTKRNREDEANIAELLPNLAITLLITLAVPFAGAGNRISLYELRAERLLNEGKPDEALALGKDNYDTSPRLTMLRAWALASTGAMTDKLFSYAIPASQRTLLPEMSDSTKMIFNPIRIYRKLGAMPYAGQTAEEYLKVIAAQPVMLQSHPQIKEYLLSTLLVNRQLKAFAEQAKLILGDSMRHEILGRHSREAIILYQHLTSAPVITLRDQALTQDFDDFMALSNRGAKDAFYRNNARLQYGDTYWYYWYYGKTQGDK